MTKFVTSQIQILSDTFTSQSCASELTCEWGGGGKVNYHLEQWERKLPERVLTSKKLSSGETDFFLLQNMFNIHKYYLPSNFK